MNRDIFISYSRKNLDAVKSIEEELEAQGFTCWMDINGGVKSGSRRFSKDIIDAIDGSKCMLFFLSSESQSSEWALKEIDYATSEKRNVVLVRFNDDPMTKEFRFDFGRADIIDWRRQEQKEKLLRDLSIWSGRNLACSESGSFGSFEASNPEAMYQMALRHKIGDGVGQNLSKAASLFRCAAEQGHSAAQNDYGVCLQKGQGVAKDPAQAVQWYRKAAESGYAPAQLNLGYCLDRGEGIAKNPEGAVQWYRAAAEQGNAWAQCNLGMSYEVGNGVEQDEDEARYWYELAAEQGDATARKGLRRLSRRVMPSSAAAGTVFGRDSVGPKMAPAFPDGVTDDTLTLPGCDNDDLFGGVSGGDFHGRIGDFRLTSILGEGTYGKVYRGDDVYTAKTRAFKRYSGFSRQGDANVIKKRFKRVCAALCEIDPNSALLAVPRDIFCVSENDFSSDGCLHAGDLVVEMDLALGKASDKWAKEEMNNSSEWAEDVLDVCGQIAAALDAIHESGLVHRDVSPANIVVSSRENGKSVAHLCDFDLMAFHNELLRPLPIVGTPGFIAPEILADLKVPDRFSDQYSLACVLYRLLAGNPPFDYVPAEDFSSVATDNPKSYLAIKNGSVLWNLLHTKPKPVSVLNIRQNDALSKALSFSSSSRYSSCQQMVDAVRTGTLPQRKGWLDKVLPSRNG